MGGYSVFGYNSSFDNSISYPDPSSIPVIEEFSSNTYFNDITYYNPSYTNLIIQTTDLTITASSLYELIRNASNNIQYNYITNTGGFNINGVTSSTTSRFNLTKGIYIFSSIGNKMAIMNHSIQTKIEYTGGGIITKGIGRDGNSYDYYKDYLIVYVYSIFGFVSMDILGSNVYGNYALCYF